MRSRTRPTLSFARDAISELRQKSEQLETSRREAGNAPDAKGLFLANPSHEFRTPMNGIIGVIELTLDTELDRDPKESISTVQRSARDLLLIVNDVSKIDSGAMHDEDQPFSIHGCVRDALALSAAQGSVGDIDVDCDIDGEVADVVSGDESRLGQILVHILGNSVEFTEEGYVHLRVTAVVEPEQLVIEAQDTGVGINREKLETILEAFTQAEDSTTRRFGGTCLGLAISRDPCVGTGGQMEVESDEGRGDRPLGTAPGWRARPRARAPRGSDPEPPAPHRRIRTTRRALLDRSKRTSSECNQCSPGDGGSTGAPVRPLRRVLLVEDDRVNGRVAERLPTSWDHRVESTPDGAVAAVLTATSDGHVVLTDIQTPAMDGLSATRQIRMREARTGDAPVQTIAMAANATPETAADGGDGRARCSSRSIATSASGTVA